MSHEDLIVSLASSAEPVTPLPAPRVRMARWTLLVLVVIGVGVAARGLRVNWASAFVDPTFLVTNGLILVVALLAAWTAFALSVPGGLRASGMKWVPVLGLLAWGGILTQQVAASGDLMTAVFTERVVFGCMWKTYGIAIGPALAIILLARRAAPLDWRWTGGLAALSALAFGVIGTELICPVTRHAHLLTWHFLPVAAMAVVAFAVCGYSARRP